MTQSNPLTPREISSPTPVERRGRAVLYGLGLGEGDGHTRCTVGEHFRLLGGSDNVHASMLEHAQTLTAEIERQGFALQDLSHDDLPLVRAIVERHLASLSAPRC